MDTQNPTQPEATTQPAPAVTTTETPQPLAPTPEATNPTPPAQPPMPDPVAVTPPSPAQPPAPKKGMNIFMVLSLLLLVLLFAGAGYFYMLSKTMPVKEVARLAYPTKAVTPTLSVSLTPSPSGTTSAKGTVTGTLCYPSSMVPAGTITAKSVTTGKEITQAYAGTQNGAATTYTFSLPADNYHLKFTPTQYATVIGYYTDYSSCVGNPSGANCSGQKTRPLLTATVSANATIEKVNLCDYYYPPSNPPQF